MRAKIDQPISRLDPDMRIKLAAGPESLHGHTLLIGRDHQRGKVTTDEDCVDAAVMQQSAHTECGKGTAAKEIARKCLAKAGLHDRQRAFDLRRIDKTHCAHAPEWNPNDRAAHGALV